MALLESTVRTNARGAHFCEVPRRNVKALALTVKDAARIDDAEPRGSMD